MIISISKIIIDNPKNLPYTEIELMLWVLPISLLKMSEKEIFSI